MPSGAALKLKLLEAGRVGSLILSAMYSHADEDSLSLSFNGKRCTICIVSGFRFPLVRPGLVLGGCPTVPEKQVLNSHTYSCNNSITRLRTHVNTPQLAYVHVHKLPNRLRTIVKTPWLAYVHLSKLLNSLTYTCNSSLTPRYRGCRNFVCNCCNLAMDHWRGRSN